MVILAWVLVLGSACLHALWNALLKRSRDIPSASLGILGVSVAVTGLLTPWVPRPLFPSGSLAWALAAGLGEGCYFVGLARTLRAAPLGWGYSWMRGVGMLLVWPVSVLCLGEPLRPLAAASVALVCLGLALMGLVSARGQGFRAFGWACATGVCIAGYTLCYKASLAHGAHPVPLYGLAMLVAMPIQIAVTRARGASLMPRDPGLVLLAGVLCAASFLFYLQALTLAGAGILATLRNTAIVFAVLFSRIIGERPGARQWTGAALITAGAVDLAWP
jgi:drug/metabolite transporter (DMT)-like permease